VVLEEAPPAAEAPPSGRVTVPVSARTPQALRDALVALLTVAKGGTDAEMYNAFMDVSLGTVAFGVIAIRELDQSFVDTYSTAVSVQNLRPRWDRRVVAVVLGALAVVVFAPEAPLTWIPVVMAAAVLLTFTIQLGLARKEGLVERIVASLAGAFGILVLATLAGIVLIPNDAQVVVRWGLNLQPTQTMPKFLALLQMPVATAILWGLFWAIGRYGNAERHAGQAKALAIALPAVTALLALLQVAIVVTAR